MSLELALCIIESLVGKAVVDYWLLGALFSLCSIEG